MANSTATSTTNPGPNIMYGYSLKTSAQISKPELAQAGIISVSRSSTSARESLQSVQREDDEGRTSKRKDVAASFENAGRDLLQKGILLPSSGNNNVTPSYLRTHGSSLPNAELVSVLENSRNGHPREHHQLLHATRSRNIDPPPSLHSVQMRREGPSSPDSGYGNTPESVMRTNLLSPSSRSGSSSSETTTTSSDDTGSFRRTPTSSGVPSSLWSGHESTLEFVAEDEEDFKEKETSSNSDEGNDFYPTKTSPDPDSSIVGPLPNIGHPDRFMNGDQNSPSDQSYFTPDDNTIVQVTKRKGITRSSSVENDIKSVPFSDNSVSGSITSSTKYHTTGSESSLHYSRTLKTESRKRKSLGRKRAHSVIKDAGGRFLMEGKDTFQIQDELSKDNFHFILSEALLSVIEEYKSKLHEQAYDEYLTKRSSTSSDTLCSPTHLESGDLNSDFFMQETLAASTVNGRGSGRSLKDSPSSMRESTISLHQKWLEENYRANITRGSPMGETVSVLHLLNSPSASNSAVGTANGLLQYISKVLGGNAQVEFRLPQVVQLPSDFVTSIKKQELLRFSVSEVSSPIRGSTDWAPPRRQVIHTVHQYPSDIDAALLNQGGKCAGCSMNINTSQPKALRFCNYTGKFFCVSCHHNASSYIPGHIVSNWSFKRLQVSNFARDTLTDIEKVPLFHLESLNPDLYKTAPELSKVKAYRHQLINLRKYITTCSRAEKLQSDYEEYYSSSNGDVHLYSLNDFIAVKDGNLAKELKELISEGEKHVKTCLVCQGKGFVCEFCKNDQSIIFPFQLKTTSQCPKCFSCFHKSCYNDKSCPRCERIKERQQQRLKTVMQGNHDN